MPRTTGARNKVVEAGAARAKAWQSMRILRTFTAAQLQTTAEISSANVEKFCKRLREAGYLVVAKPRLNGCPGSYNVYRLVRDSGPKCPVCWSDGRVYDPNLDKAFPEPAPEVANG